MPSANSVSLWNLEQKRSENVFETGELPERNSISDVRFANGGKTAVATINGKMYAWDIASDSRIKNETGLDFFHAIGSKSPKQWVASINSDKKSIVVWSLTSGKTRRVFTSPSPILATGISAFGEKLCALDKNGKLSVWNVQSGKEVQISNDPCFGQWIEYAPDSNFVLIRGEGTAHIVHLATGKTTFAQNLKTDIYSNFLSTEHFFDNHKAKQISNVEFLSDGKKVLVTTYDGTIECWDYTTGILVFTLYFPGEEDWVVTTPSGLFDASPGAMQQMYYRYGAEVIEIEQLKQRYFEPWLLQKLMGFSSGEPRSVDGLGSLELYPILQARIIQDSLKIHLTERNGGLGKLSLFINDKEVEENINPDQLTDLSIGLNNYSNNFFLPDTLNTIALRTFNAEGWLKSSAYYLNYEAPRAKGRNTNAPSTDPKPFIKAKPSLYALVIGTSNYSGDKLDLKFADKDAAAMAQALQSAGTALFGERVYVKLLSTAAGQGIISSKSNIKAAFTELMGEKTKPGDILIVYFSGHGTTFGTAEKAQFYYLTKDIESEDLKDPAYRDNYTISSEELTQWLTDIRALKQVLILDACNSGKFIESFAADNTKELSPAQERAFDRMKDRTGTFILTGSAADKVSFESSKYGQGLLTYSLLLGMSGEALTSDKRMDVITLFQYSREEVPELAKEISGIQIPMLSYPIKGNSFDIGISNADVKIPVANVKPVFIRCNFQDENEFDDVLGFNEEMIRYFQELTSKSSEAEIVFVDENSYNEAYSLKGRYTVKGNVVEVRGRLFRGKSVVHKFTKSGNKNDLVGLVRSIVDDALPLAK
jgi:hypothetical protein